MSALENNTIFVLALFAGFLATGTVSGQVSACDLPMRDIFNLQDQAGPQTFQSSSPNQNPPANTRDPSTNPPPALQSQGTGKHRHHLIELTRSNWHPLTDSEKFELFWRD